MLVILLEKLENQPEHLALEVHNHWVRRRQSEGWVLGPAEPAHRSTPYLKPLTQFNAAELEREILLASNDLRGIIEAVKRLNPIGALSAKAQILDPSNLLIFLGLDVSFVEEASAIIHDGWRKTNLMLRMRAGDVRLDHPFCSLSATNKRITLGNVRADIEAFAKLVAQGGLTSSA